QYPLIPDPSPVFFFNDPATTEIYTLSLHDALPISSWRNVERAIANLKQHDLMDAERLYAVKVPKLEQLLQPAGYFRVKAQRLRKDRKSTRLNSSHVKISYAVFCLKKKTLTKNINQT